MKKCIYGLKQAPRAWYQKFSPVLVEFGLVQSQTDPCLFLRRQQGEILIVIIFVDDSLVLYNNTLTFQDLTQHLKQHFEIRVLPATRFIGIDIEQDKKNGRIFLHQHSYTVKLLDKFNMGNCNPKLTPSDPNVRFTKDGNPQEETADEEPLIGRYREILGGIMYLAVSTRPDIAQALNVLARFAENPKKEHMTGAKHLLAYLKGTTTCGLLFDAGHPTILTGYADADFGGDLIERKSTSGYIFLLSGGPIVWASRRQECVAQSTTEAELISVNEATREAVWLKRMLEELEPCSTSQIEIKCDNQSAIRLTNNSELHRRSKHIELKHFYVRQEQLKKNVKIVYIDSLNQLADGLTKGLPRPRFEELWSKLGVISGK